MLEPGAYRFAPGQYEFVVFDIEDAFWFRRAKPLEVLMQTVGGREGVFLFSPIFCVVTDSRKLDIQ